MVLRARTICPTCGRDVSFTTNLAVKFLPRHNDPKGRPCPTRRVPVGA